MNEPIDLFGDREFSSPVEAARFAAEFASANPEITHFYLVPEKVAQSERIVDLARWAIMASKAIATIRPAATFILPVRAELTVAKPGENKEGAAREANIHRFALLDLIMSIDDPLTEEYLQRHGLSSAEYAWFMDQKAADTMLLDIRTEPNEEHITQEYLDRYGVEPL